MATLPVLSPKQNLKGKRVFLRVDWNVPLKPVVSGFAPEDSLKISRSIETIKGLSDRGATVIIATHLGRPKGKDAAFSTKRLVATVAKASHVPMTFIGEALDDAKGHARALKIVKAAKPGSVFLLENVRFYEGEEQNAPTIANAFASLAQIFVNDAFASCHRAHASVVGVAKRLPAYAGPTLVHEVEALEKLLTKPKHPFVAVIGGVKIATKIGALETLLKTADRVFVGGAMANTLLAAKKREIGRSFYAKEELPLARKLLKHPNLVLPIDAVVAKKIGPPAVSVRLASVKEIKKNECIGDIGPQTMTAWSIEIRNAQTIMWNGPLGISEIPTFSHGSLVVGKAIAIRSRGKAYGVIGGGDTLPVALATGMSEWVDHLSMGGGAMLDFIANKGRLPGLIALKKKTA